MTLLEVVRDIRSLDPDGTIYVKDPWCAGAEAYVLPGVPRRGESLRGFAARGIIQFMSVEMARDFLDAWLEDVSSEPALEERCSRLVHYAEFDG